MKNLRLLTQLYFRQVWRDVPFLIIVCCGLGLMVAFLLMIRGAYDAQVMPLTYEATDVMRRFQPALWAALLLFGGELSAKERSAGISPLLDVLPYQTGARLSAQILTMHLVGLCLISLLMITGICTQLLSDVNDINLALYLQIGFLEIFFNTSFMICLGFFLHTLVNHRFAGHVIIISIILIRGYLPAWGLEHPLFHYGSLSLGRYSDLNGFASASVATFWHYALYWLSLGLFFLGLSRLLLVRGIETGLNLRLRILISRIGFRSTLFIGSSFTVFLLSGSAIYLQSTKQHEYYSIKEIRAYRAAYEKELKAFEKMATPEITSVSLAVDLYPDEDRYVLKGSYGLFNPWDEPITSLFIQGNLNPKIKTDSVQFSRDIAAVESYEQYRASLYKLKSPLQPGDSMLMNFNLTYENLKLSQPYRENLTQTASFFTNDQLPALTYRKDNELQSTRRRAAFGLAPRKRELDQQDPAGYEMGINQAHSVHYEAIISTRAGHQVTTSGALIGQWQEGQRSFYHFRSKNPIENQFVIITGKWEQQEDSVQQGKERIKVNLWHHYRHNKQTASMKAAMVQSLAYYGEHFSPYQYDQLNLTEVPRAHDFAMSVPNTIAYSEALGFANVEADSIIPYFITAHEVAHQWWGDQVRAARVKGQSMIVETLAQYSAGVVTLAHAGQAALNKVLLYERGRYLRRRKQEVQQEQPLALAEDQAYIHYGKGLVNMMALRHYITEDSLNHALKRFIDRFPANEQKYPNSRDLIHEIKQSTPDSLQYLITDLFERITFWDGRIVEAGSVPQPDGSFEINAQFELKKLVADSEGNLKEVKLEDWVEIEVFGLDEQGKEYSLYQQMHRFTEANKDLRLKLSTRPHRIALDPRHLLMDRNIDDNSFGLR